jgi:Holliday junction resolvase RusA-like endonuclease
MSGAQITVIIAGTAVAKGRPRVTRKGFFYTPASTRKYETHGRLCAQEVMVDRAPIAVPVKAEISVDLPVPQSWSAKRQAAALAGYIRPTSRPDTDNYVKAALDGIAITDDPLVTAEKRYARVPKLTITVMPLPSATANGGRRHERHLPETSRQSRHLPETSLSAVNVRRSLRQGLCRGRPSSGI